MKDNFKIISGVIAVGVYFLLISLILYYFNYRSSTKSVHYVAKNTNSISVTLTTKKLSKPKPKEKRKKQHVKKVRNTKTTKSNKIKYTKKVKQEKKAKPIKAKELFASVKTKIKKNNKSKGKQQKTNKSIKKSKSNDKGKVNKYFANIEEKLKGWPAQANFAGETISITLKVYKSGSFEFEINKLSSNTDFNESLLAYLKQLQSIGFGTHSSKKPYQIEVEFVATD